MSGAQLSLMKLYRIKYPNLFILQKFSAFLVLILIVSMLADIYNIFTEKIPCILTPLANLFPDPSAVFTYIYITVVRHKSQTSLTKQRYLWHKTCHLLPYTRVIYNSPLNKQE